MANENLGKCDCPVCSGEAVIRESKKQRAYIMCEGCGFQGFARSQVSDLALRGRIKNAVVEIVGESSGAGVSGVGGVGRNDGGSKAESSEAGSARATKGHAESGLEPAKKPAQQKAPVMHTADGQEVPGAAPAVPEFNLIDGLAGLFK